MDWLGDIGNAVGGFFNNLFGGNKDDEERKRRERERRQQEQQRQQQARQDSAVQSAQNSIPLMNQQGNDPFNINRHFGLQDKQEDNQKPVFDLSLGKTNTRQVNGRPVVINPSKEEREKIPGYHVMSPEAQRQAVAKQRQQDKIKAARYNGLSDEDRKTAISLEKRGKDATAFIKAARQAAEAKKEADWNNSFLGKLTNFGGEVWNMTGDPLVKTVETLGNMGASSIIDITGGDENMKKAARERTKETFDKSAPGYFFNALGTLGTAIGSSLAGNKLLDEGIDPKIVQEAMDSYTEQYGLSSKQSDLENSLAIGTAGLTTAFGAASPVITGVEGTILLPLTRNVISKVGSKADPKAIKTAIQEVEKELSVKLSDAEKKKVEEAVKKQAAKEATTESTPNSQNKSRSTTEEFDAEILSDNATTSLKNNPQNRLNKPNRLDGEGYSLQEARTGLTQTGKDLDGRIVFGKNDSGEIIIKDGTHLLEAYRTEGLPVPARKVGFEDGVTPEEVAKRRQEVLAEAKEKIEAPVAKTQEVIPEQQAQQAKQNSVKQGGGLNYDEMMERLAARRQTNQPAQDTRAAMIQKEAPIDYSDEALAGRMADAGLTGDEVSSLTQQYGISKGEWQALMNRLGSLENANSRPAVVVSELRKLRAEGIHGQTKAAMNNNVTAQRLAKEAEEATPVVQTEGGAVIDAPVAKNQPVRNQSLDMTAERFIDDIINGRATFDDVPPSLRREVFESVYGDETGRVIDTPAGKTDVRTGEIIDDAPDDLTLVEQYQRELNEKATAYINEVRQLEEAVKRLGFEPRELRRKAQAANRGEYKMTDEEATAHRLFEDRLNQARLKGEEEGLVFEGNQIHYSPQVREGEVDLPKTREDLMSFGYANQRKNAIPLDELDYGEMPLVDYIMRAENRNLQIKQSMARAAEIDGRTVTREGIEQAAKDTEAIQKKVKDSSKSEKVLNNDTIGDLNKIGINEGYQQTVNNTVAGKLAQEPMEMLQRAGVYDRGFEQFDNTVGYAHEFTRQVVDNNIPPQQLAEALTRSLRSAMPNADKSAIDEAVSGTIRRIQNRKLTGTDIAPQIASAFRSVAKSELFKLGKTTNFTDKKMRAVVNEQINARLMQDAYSKNFAQELDSFIAQRINASLRGLNIVSAAFELGDVANILSQYGVKNLKNSKIGFGKVDGETFGMSRKYGETHSHFLSADLPEVRRLDEVWADPNTNIGQKLKRSYEVGENKLLIFRYVEQYKTELFFREADNYWRNQGLQGTDLVNQVMRDYHKTMLPNKIITTNRILGKMPKSLTQYLNWSVQATKRLGRTLAGTNEAGVYKNMGRGSRIARGVTTELAPKIAVAALLGVPIQQILGMRDWTGMTDGDFSGIPEEEKNALDHIMGYVGMSPVLGVISNAYYAGRRNEIAANDDDDRTQPNDNWLLDSLGAEASKLIPFYTQINKTLGVQDGVDKGYFENKDGRVQFEAPEAGSLDHILGLITGKTYLRQNRDYSDNPDFISVLQGKASLGDLFTHNQTVDNLVQSLGGDTARDYDRPVSNNDFSVGLDENGNPIDFNYNEWVKGQFSENREQGSEALKDAKYYNEVLDNVRRENPEAYEAYQRIMENNDLVTPEYWSAITDTNSEGGFDLTLVKMMGARKKAVAEAAAKATGNKDLAQNYDPMYDLDDDQLRSVIQMKSTATGDDIALRNILNKQDWYREYTDKVSAYYDRMPVSEDDFDQTERVKTWNKYSDELNRLNYMLPDDRDSEEVAAAKAAIRQRFPYNAAYQKARDEYEKRTGKDFYGSEESKQWFRMYGDGKKAEDEQLDAAKLLLINRMREIEGHPPMTPEAYEQATNIANTSGGGGGGGGGRRGGGDDVYNFIADFTQPRITWQDIVSIGSTSSKPRAFKPNTSVGRRTNSNKRMGARSRGVTA